MDAEVASPDLIKASDLYDECSCSEAWDLDVAMEEDTIAKAMAASAAGAPTPTPTMVDTLRASTEVHTQTQEVGDLFAYEITHSVDIGRSRSALVPILQTDAEIERVALYNRLIREKNPMTAVRLKNSTGLTLEGGPVTVFEGNCYVGESMMDTIRRDEERLIPYSVELGVTVSLNEETVQESYSRAVKKGQYIHKHYRRLKDTHYEFHSGLDKDLNLYFDHSYTHSGREETPEPVEVTDHYWRFNIVLPPKRATFFRVREVSEAYDCVEIQGIVRSMVYQMASEALISEEVKRELDRIADRVEDIQSMENEIQEKEQQKVNIEKGQGRLRDNLKALGSTVEEAKLRRMYVTTLTGEEESIEKLRKEAMDLKVKLAHDRKVLNEMVEALKL